MNDRPAVLSVKNLNVQAIKQRMSHEILRNITFELKEGEIIAVIGESGSGKSTLALSILGLLPYNFKISGSIEFVDSSLNGEKRTGKKRYENIGMIFQDPVTALNPTLRIKLQLYETLQVVSQLSFRELKERSLELLARVEIGDPPSILNKYPHQLSGGMCQRVLIAIALARRTDLLIADEPTSNLDTTIEAQIMEILKKLAYEEMMSMIFISHDLQLVGYIADKIMVLYGGKIIESAYQEELLRRPLHPYTWGLIRCFQLLSEGRDLNEKPIKGHPSPNFGLIPGCVYHPRCPYCKDICKTLEPELNQIANRLVACHFAGELDFPETGRELRR